MAFNVYDLMKKSVTEVDQEGLPYVDPLTLNLNSFRVTRPALQYTLTETDISRIDLLMYQAYNLPYYDDLLLLLNNQGILDDVDPGTDIYLPERVDIENFILNSKNKL